MRLWWLAAAASLAGCTLIDQRTFDPHAGEKPVVLAPPAPLAEAPELGGPALVRIVLPIPADARSTVDKAVRAARARKADVAFTVTEVGPGGVSDMGGAAERVAQMITADGIPAARVSLAARPMPDVRREVRVYVR